MALREFVMDHYYPFYFASRIMFVIPSKIMGEKWDLWKTKKRYKQAHNKELNLDDPQTLNEKLQWLKLYNHTDLQTKVADKYTAREYWSKFGEDGLVPLLYKTDNWKDITMDVIPDEPCIVKCSGGSASYQIIRDKSDVNIKKLRERCRIWLSCNFYYIMQEWQYKNAKPVIMIEKLLLDKNGKIPNDYKLHYINGELQFVYCSVDREGENYRSIYSPDWERLDLEWMEEYKHGAPKGADIPAPPTFEKMKEIAGEVAKDFPYVRVDFYDVDGHLYYGEITLFHGSGFDTFYPREYDKEFGDKLVLPKEKHV